MSPFNISQKDILVYNGSEEILVDYVYYECPICKCKNIFYAEDSLARNIVENNLRTDETEQAFRKRVKWLKQLVKEELHAKETNTSGNRKE